MPQLVSCTDSPRVWARATMTPSSLRSSRSLGQLFKTIGADPDNEVMIFTGTGPSFMTRVDPEGFALEEADLEHLAYEYAFRDGRRNVLALVFDLEIPTIGALNGPGFHAELCLMCDLTICSEDAVIFDPHFQILGNTSIPVAQYNARTPPDSWAELSPSNQKGEPPRRVRRATGLSGRPVR